MVENFELGGGSDFAFTHSKIAGQGLTETKRIETASIVVAVDESGDFQSIQEAINALNGKGGYIQVKEGTYNITEEILIPSSVTIEGTGRNTILKGSSSNILKVTGDYSVIKNCYFLGVNQTETGIDANGRNKLIISDCFFDNLLIGIETGNNLTFSSIKNNFFDYACLTYINITDMYWGNISNNISEDITTRTFLNIDYAEGVLITGNTTASTITITDSLSCNISSNTLGNITIAGDQNLITSNTIGIITDTGTGNIITNNL